ncbi:hypothetical protein [Nonomuraea fuscirosea]|uniref:hypothetical protein n=1 Tax=Nonomuraea fuscirosea TaxID=1291556 RepID=UPI00342D4D9E
MQQDEPTESDPHGIAAPKMMRGRLHTPAESVSLTPRFHPSTWADVMQHLRALGEPDRAIPH